MSERADLGIDHFLNSSMNADILSNYNKKDLTEEQFWNKLL